MTQTRATQEAENLLRGLHSLWTGKPLSSDVCLDAEVAMVDAFLAEMSRRNPLPLEDLIALLRRTGVTHFASRDVSLTLGPEPYHEEPKKEPAHDDDNAP